MSETALKYLRTASAALAACAILTGCGSDPFVGTYEFGDTGQILTVKGDGTCTNNISGLDIACKWKKNGTDSYRVSTDTFLGGVTYFVRKAGSGYVAEMVGTSVPLERK